MTTATSRPLPVVAKSMIPAKQELRVPMAPVKGTISMLALKHKAEAARAHVKKCKQPTHQDCISCKQIVKWFGTLSPLVLSQLCENPQAFRLHGASLKDRLVQNAVNKANDSKRGESSFHALASLVAYHKQHFPKQYV